MLLSLEHWQTKGSSHSEAYNYDKEVRFVVKLTVCEAKD